MSDFDVDVLAFGPHPDDVEIFCGGIMLALKDLGRSTGLVDLTRGELASHGTPEERAQESAAANQVLGVGFRENLGLPDGAIDASSVTQLATVVEVIRRRRPELVLLPWREERHPDHVATSLLVTKALFFAGVRKFETEPGSSPFAPRQALHYAMRYRVAPSFVVNTSAVWTRKVQAIACHKSQLTRRPGEAETLISAPDSLQAIETRDRYHGSLIGTQYGEALRSQGVLGLVDPVAHFRANAFGPVHAFEALG